MAMSTGGLQVRGPFLKVLKPYLGIWKYLWGPTPPFEPRHTPTALPLFTPILPPYTSDPGKFGG